MPIAFGDVPLENFDKFALQMHINKLAKARCKDTVLQIRAYMRDIFAEAVDQGFLAKDPARKVKVPTQPRPTDKTVLSWDQLRAVLANTALRDWILLQLDMANALRPGEPFALRWRALDVAECTLTLTETIYKGKLRPWGKTRGSLTTIPIAEELARDLAAWRERCPDPSPEAVVFAAPRGGFMDSNNYRNRFLKKPGRELGLPKLNFQAGERLPRLHRRKAQLRMSRLFCGMHAWGRRPTFTCRRILRRLGGGQLHSCRAAVWRRGSSRVVETGHKRSIQSSGEKPEAGRRCVRCNKHHRPIHASSACKGLGICYKNATREGGGLNA
jgi:integrase